MTLCGIFSVVTIDYARSCGIIESGITERAEFLGWLAYYMIIIEKSCMADSFFYTLIFFFLFLFFCLRLSYGFAQSEATISTCLLLESKSPLSQRDYS